MMLWRAWHLRNDIIHGKGEESVQSSVRFLISYRESLQIAKAGSPESGDRKGKKKLFEDDRQKELRKQASRSSTENAKWSPPPMGWVKINSDASFCISSGKASAGIVIRDDRGQVLLTSWKVVSNCTTAMEAEAVACLEEVRLAVEWVRLPARLEADCSMLIDALTSLAPTRASWTGVLQDIRGVGALLPEVVFDKVKREANSVAHSLAKLAVANNEMVVKRFRFPDCVRSIVELEAKEAEDSALACNKPVI